MRKFIKKDEHRIKQANDILAIIRKILAIKGTLSDTPIIPDIAIVNTNKLAEAQEKLFGAAVMGRLSKRQIMATTDSFNELINVAHEYYDLQGNKQTVELKVGGDTSQVLTTREKLIASGMRQAALAEKLKSKCR